MKNGPIVRSIIAYAIPVMLGSLIQVAFNAADLMVVGNLGDATALAAVGAVSPIVGLLVNSFVGLSAGVNAVLSRCLGYGDENRAKRIINTSVIFSFVFGFVLMAAVFLFSRPLLKLSGCEQEYFEQSVTYMNLYALGIPAIMVYNFAGAIIRTSGDTQRPFIYLVIAGVMNVALNFALCLVWENKAGAVALATTVSQLVGAVLCFIHLCRSKGICTFAIKNISFSFRELGTILKIGLPCSFNSMLFSLSNVQMNAAINSYGVNATAGNAAACNLETLSSSFCSGFITATVCFVGQNVGAGNPARVKKSIWACFAISTILAAISSLSIYLLRDYVLTLYIPDEPGAIAFAVSRMHHVLLLMPISAAMNVFVSALQAFGYSVIPTINSIMTVLVFRVIWLEWVYPRLEAIKSTIDNVYLCYSVSWVLTLIAHSVMFTIIYTRYRRGKLKQI